MNLRSLALFFFSLAFVLPSFATVSVSSPANGSTVGASVPFVASGNTTTCSKGVAAMGVYVDNSLAYQVDGTSLNTTLKLASGAHRTVVEEWDKCGGATTAVINLTVSGVAGVSIASPANGASVSTSTTFSATGSSPSCAAGVTAMQIYANSALVYTRLRPPKSTPRLPSPEAPTTLTFKEWDRCGGVASSAITVSVVAGNKLANLQAAPKWNQWGELPPIYDICSSCKGLSWLMTQGIKSISLSGNATKFTIGGTYPYADVLWSNKLVGQGTTLGMPDSDRKILPNIRNLIFDAEIYPTNMAVTQDIELDANIYLDGVGMEWGTQCNHLNDGVWDIWNNIEFRWVPTSVPCSLNEGQVEPRRARLRAPLQQRPRLLRPSPSTASPTPSTSPPPALPRPVLLVWTHPQLPDGRQQKHGDQHHLRRQPQPHLLLSETMH